ncbi:MAG: outer membrane beta-barrel protein [Bacteroidota bacterium]|nr:outer membrane beta-barrel protein [Bacteroidota bacterium]
MKRLLVTLALISIFSFSKAQQLQLGLRFNPQISWYNITNENQKLYIENDAAKLGFSYGLMADVNFTENYALSSGIFHNLFYAKTSVDTSIFSPDYKDWKLQYIQIPLLLKMKTNVINNFIYYGKFGLTPQMRINAEVDTKVAENIRLFNLYLTIGGGIHYLIGGNTALLGGITFHNGFVKINKDDEFNIKTGYFSLDLGVLF